MRAARTAGYKNVDMQIARARAKQPLAMQPHSLSRRMSDN